jgi:hypothetical protein
MITLAQLDEAIDLYERCLKEKWGFPKIYKLDMERGLCLFMMGRYGYELSLDMPIKYSKRYIWETFIEFRNYRQAFAPRIAFLKTLREELIKEGYWDLLD